MKKIEKTPTNYRKFKTVKNILHFQRDSSAALQFLKNNQNEIDVSWTTPNQSNLLLVALEQCKKDENLLELVRYLIEKDIDINYCQEIENEWGNALYKIISSAEFRRRDNKPPSNLADLEIIQLLLDHNAQVDHISNREYHMNTTCLMLASCLPHPIFLQVFQKTKFPINTQQSEGYYDGPLGGYTAAHWAAGAAQIDNLQFLLDNGADLLIEEFRDQHSALALLYEENQEEFKLFMLKNPQLIEPEIARLITRLYPEQPILYEGDSRILTQNALKTLQAIQESMKINKGLDLICENSPTKVKKLKI